MCCNDRDEELSRLRRKLAAAPSAAVAAVGAKCSCCASTHRSRLVRGGGRVGIGMKGIGSGSGAAGGEGGASVLRKRALAAEVTPSFGPKKDSKNHTTW